MSCFKKKYQSCQNTNWHTNENKNIQKWMVLYEMSNIFHMDYLFFLIDVKISVVKIMFFTMQLFISAVWICKNLIFIIFYNFQLCLVAWLTFVLLLIVSCLDEIYTCFWTCLFVYIFLFLTSCTIDMAWNKNILQQLLVHYWRLYPGN